MTIPMTLSAVGNSFFRMVEDVWTIDGLEMSGEENAMEIYGLIRGMTMPLLVFPLNLISSFMALLVPEVSRAEENGRLKSIVKHVGKMGLMFGLMVFVVFYVFAEEISLAVYGTNAAAEYIKPLSLLCPIIIMDSLSGGMLGGLGEQSTLLRYSVADTALRLFLVYFILPLKGTLVIIVMTFLSNFLTCGLNVQKIRKKAGEYILLKDILKFVVYTVVAVFILSRLYHIVN
jgi:stage V sporulation protein B